MFKPERLTLLTATTLPDALRDCADQWPDQPLYFPEQGEQITVRQLNECAVDFAHQLASYGVGGGRVVGVVSGAGPHVLMGLFGITLTGAAASLLPTPPMTRDSVSAARQVIQFLDAADMRYLLVDPSQSALADEVRKVRPGITVLPLPSGVTHGAAVAADRPAAASGAELPRVQPDDIAVIQYTSGSTSVPKGVVLRHRTVLAGLRSIGASAQVSNEDVFIQWVPHFHDMGLIGWLAYLLHGAATHTFSPGGFIRRPAAFLRYFAEHKGTVTCGPDFGYDLMLDAVSDAEISELELQSWRFAFNGSEPVSAATVETFTRRLAPAGLSPSVMFPVYGMAEATLGITFPVCGDIPHVVHLDRGLLLDKNEVRLVDPAHPDAKTVVAVGRPIEGMELRLTDRQGQPVEDDELGEVQIRGGAVTEEYFRNTEATQNLFTDGWLCTGDLAFRHDDRLYVTGRVKDMIIVHGRNFFAQDVEAVVRDIPGVYRQRCVAIPEVTEVLRVVVETRQNDEEMADRIRVRIANELGLSAIEVHLVRPGQLPRTTSGKWKRTEAAHLTGAAR
ncbi:AMP-binding protein [Actinacidiphila glaucinigra]|uniref:AMP-binding protein n=1 Tax=Actinacidiphila glaucinigra TaxID=235986 RepID=UPI0037CA8E62